MSFCKSWCLSKVSILNNTECAVRENIQVSISWLVFLFQRQKYLPRRTEEIIFVKYFIVTLVIDDTFIDEIGFILFKDIFHMTLR